MSFEKWIAGEMDRGLSQLEVDQMYAAWQAATETEREACAKVCDDYVRGQLINSPAKECAVAIRRRT